MDRVVVEALRADLRGRLRAAAQFALPVAALADVFRHEPGLLFAHLAHADHQPVAPRQRRPHRDRRVEHHQVPHIVARCLKLPRDLQRREAAAGKAADQPRTLGLDLPHLGDAACRGLGKAFMRRVLAVKPARLQAIDGALRRQPLRQRAQVQDVAEHARDDEEGQPAAGGACVHGDQVGKARRGRGGHEARAFGRIRA